MENLEALQERVGGTLHKVVAEYEWTPVDTNGVGFWDVIKIKVHQIASDRFQAGSSHSVHKTGLATPYTALEEGNSIEEALTNCIRAMRTFIGTTDNTTLTKRDDLN